MDMRCQWVSRVQGNDLIDADAVMARFARGSGASDSMWFRYKGADSYRATDLQQGCARFQSRPERSRL